MKYSKYIFKNIDKLLSKNIIDCWINEGVYNLIIYVTF